VISIAVIDPQPALRTGLGVLLRAEPGLVPVGGAAGWADGLELARRRRPAIVLLDHQLLNGDGLGLCRRLRELPDPPRVILYSADEDPGLHLLARLAGADGLVSKAAPPPELFDAIRVVARGGSELPELDASDVRDAAHRVEPEDLALLAMLADRTPTADVAATLRVDPRRLTRRIERLMRRLRARPRAAAV
jgi:DNA-binding NarL/FixJ family response regulator